MINYKTHTINEPINLIITIKHDDDHLSIANNLNHLYILSHIILLIFSQANTYTYIEKGGKHMDKKLEKKSTIKSNYVHFI